MTPNPRERDVWWAVGRATVGTLVKTAFRLRVAGAANVPASGGALLAYNHLSVIDALFVSLPIIERGRAVHFFVLREDFERRIVGWGLRKTGQIPKCRPDVNALTDRIMDDIAGLVAQARRAS